MLQRQYPLQALPQSSYLPRLPQLHLKRLVTWMAMHHPSQYELATQSMHLVLYHAPLPKLPAPSSVPG